MVVGIGREYGKGRLRERGHWAGKQTSDPKEPGTHAGQFRSCTESNRRPQGASMRG